MAFHFICQLVRVLRLNEDGLSASDGNHGNTSRKLVDPFQGDFIKGARLRQSTSRMVRDGISLNLLSNVCKKLSSKEPILNVSLMNTHTECHLNYTTKYYISSFSIN